MMRTLLVALLVVALAPAASANYLMGGNFDDAGPPMYDTEWTTDIPYWTVTSDESLLLSPDNTPPDPVSSAQAGVWYSFGDVSADTGEMVLITNWPDKDEIQPRFGTTDITKLISDPFLVNGDHKWIEFDYVYVTQETSSGNQDPFSVSVIRASNELILDSEVVTDAYDETLIHTGGISIYPFEETSPPQNRQTPGWVHGKFLIDPMWYGETVRLVFTIEDTGNDNVNSGVFLENVEQTPEPATFVIFGLGALGLGYVVRRRRRSKT